MAKFFDETGKEVEGFTQEELDAKIVEREAALKAEHQTAIETVNATLKAKEEELAKLSEKDKNFTKVKTDAEQKIEELTKQIDTFKTTMVGNKKSELLSKLSGGDAELAKKIEFEYGQFQGEALTNEEIESRMFRAFKLAEPTVQVNTLGDAIAKIGARGVNTGKPAETKTEDFQKLQKALGVSEEDLKKYGSTEQPKA